MNNRRKVDLHLHSIGSLDGLLTIEELIAGAKENGVEYIAITDHNNFSELRKFYDKHGLDYSTPMVEVDGVNIISGVEITCRVDEVKNLSGNSTKIHLLVYGADMSHDSPLSQILKLKRANDIDCDVGILRDILNERGITSVTEEEITAYIRERRQDISGYSSMSQKDAFKFLERKGITVATSLKEFNNICEHLPKYERMNISATDAILASVMSGGMVALAHPALNLERTNNKRELINFLLTHGINGFEMIYETSTDKTNALIKECVEEMEDRNRIFYTGGSDTHDFSHGNNIGIVHSMPVTTTYTKRFLSEMRKLSEARKNGEISHRDDINLEGVDYTILVNKYEERARSIEANSKVDVSHYEKKANKKKRRHRDWAKSLVEGKYVPLPEFQHLAQVHARAEDKNDPYAEYIRKFKERIIAIRNQKEQEDEVLGNGDAQ